MIIRWLIWPSLGCQLPTEWRCLNPLQHWPRSVLLCTPYTTPLPSNRFMVFKISLLKTNLWIWRFNPRQWKSLWKLFCFTHGMWHTKFIFEKLVYVHLRSSLCIYVYLLMNKSDVSKWTPRGANSFSIGHWSL